MPLPAPKQAEPRHGAGSETPSYHFDVAHGDVAALHAQIERSFRDTPLALLPTTTLPDRLESGVQMLSRAAGPAVLIATVAVIGHVLF
jgi:hypothetical protein